MAEPSYLEGLTDGGWHAMPFAPFREGVEILSICTGEPAVALLRYAPGSSIPEHVHTGLETIYVLEGAQSDERGTYEVGTMVLNPAGSRHSVWSDAGCVVLIQWEGPVRFTMPEDTE